MDKLEYIARSLSRDTNKKYETYVVNAIYQKIDNSNLMIETQKEIRIDNGYRPLIAMFLPQLNIAIEVDEGYHSGEEQQKHDIWREESINSQVRMSCSGASIDFERVKAYDISLEDINKRIDEIVDLIKTRISKLTKPLEWKSKDEILQDIIKRGTIEIDDCFDTNVEIINLMYGKSFKGFQRAGYKGLWFPVISDVVDSKTLSNRASLQNFFNSTYSIIYERSVDESKQEEKRKWSEIDKENKAKRIVFVRDRDTFGKARKRFAGVFVAKGWDDNMRAEIWKLESTVVEIPLKE